ncbi:MAG: hypothetical protein ACYC2H_02830 [Thermoplasmatota archaeon]
MARLRLLLRPWERTAAAILNVVPLPGLGAILAGWRNAHTTLRRNGALQMALVVFGAWPLIVPGAIGLAWAVWDTVRIAQADLRRLPPANAPAPEDVRQAAPPRTSRR